MKLLRASNAVHLVTQHNEEPGTWMDSEDPELPSIPYGFSQTACGRVIGGLPIDAPLGEMICVACRGSYAYKQAKIMQQMLDEG